MLHVDLNHLWHPFTQASAWKREDALIVERGEGHYLIDTEGGRYLDGVSSIWCNVHGYADEELNAALHKQTDKICHSTLLGLSHVPVLELTEELLKVCPKNLNRVFYSDSGTAAVEAGLRMALEWWQKAQGVPQRNRFASLFGAYHGDTLGSVSVGFLEAFHGSLKSVCVEASRVHPPHYYRFYQGDSPEAALQKSLSELDAFFEKEGETLAAFIVEPLVQGAAGIWIQPPRFLKRLRELCTEYSVLLIADEVATGFIKTGAMFACQLGDVQPDILIVGKSLSGGYLPISAAVTTEELYQGFIGSPSERKTFFYGQTFAGNALAAAVSTENLRLIEKRKVLEEAPGKIETFGALIDSKIAPLDAVDEVRRLGFMVGIELTQEKGTHSPFPADQMVGRKIVLEARRLGVIVRPIGNVLILMPAVSMGNEDLEKLVSVTAQAIEAAI